MNFNDDDTNNTSNNSPIAGSMVGIGSEQLLSRGNEDTAVQLLDTAHHRMLAAPSASPISLAVKHIQRGTNDLTTDDNVDSSERSQDSVNSSLCPPPDIYHDETDVGPRVLSTPVSLDEATAAPLENSIVFLEAVSLFNKALVQHSKSRLFEAKQIYELLVSGPIQNLLFAACTAPSTALLAMAMRVYNNLGLISYADGDDAQALIYFQQALLVSKQLFHLAHSFRLEHATVLSNWCRVIWMRGDVNASYFAGLREVLRIRSNLLAWDHPDVAASHFNLATAEYTRKNNSEAVFHLKQYLRVASHSRRNSEETKKTTVLDPMPAMIYLLLLQNENRQDSMSQELVRGLRSLQDKRQDEGNDSSEVASVLNFIGTLLFHKADLDDALVFFLEELRLEELFVVADKDMSVSVTCNNIGRIFQERGKFDQAISYYERALKPVYGDLLVDYEACANKHSKCELDATSKNLYSTVWYNLGLIHDKSAAYPEAIGCFKMSLELRRSILGRDHPDVACLHFNIGVLQTEQQQLDEAAVSLKEALLARGSGTASNKLSDHRFIKTLERLATLQKNKGNNQAAVDAWNVALGIMEVSTDIDSISRIEYMALVLRSISELHHAAGDLKAALVAALQSGRKLEALCAAYGNSSSTSSMSIEANKSDRLTHIEQLVSALLLVGSLHHEMCEPLRADAILGQANLVLEYTARTFKHQPLPASLLALREVASMLVTERCAAQA